MKLNDLDWLYNRTTSSEGEQAYIFRLKERKASFYPEYDLAIERESSCKEERKFWARVFYDLAHLIFCRQIESQDTTFWQYSAIGDATCWAGCLHGQSKKKSRRWHPRKIAEVEAEAYFQKGINIRL